MEKMDINSNDSETKEFVPSICATVLNDVLKVSKHNWKQKYVMNLHGKMCVQILKYDNSYFLVLFC
jgi:hypothetical protein